MLNKAVAQKFWAFVIALFFVAMLGACAQTSYKIERKAPDGQVYTCTAYITSVAKRADLVSLSACDGFQVKASMSRADADVIKAVVEGAVKAAVGAP